MNTTLRVAGYQLRDVMRSRSALVYAAFVTVTADLLLRFSAGPETALLALGSTLVLLIPLVTLLFGTLYVYAARPFHELLLTQTVTRTQLFAGTWIGMVVPLAGALLIGAMLPLLWHGALPAALAQSVLVLALGVVLTLVCAGCALLVAAAVSDRMRGIVLVIALWLALALLYDGFVLLVTALFRDYPLEKPLVTLMLINPIDLVRVLLLVEFDAAAMMGHTGAVLRRVTGETGSRVLGAAALACWLLLPPLAAWRIFERRDF